MIIGFTTLNEVSIEKSRLFEEGNCDTVEVIVTDTYTADVFLNFLRQHRGDKVVVTSIEAIYLSLTHYRKIEKVVEEYEINLHFLDKEMFSDTDYLKMLSSLARCEARIMSRRTSKGLERAWNIGKISGRPQINPKKIKQIQGLYTYKKKTLREIADVCQVSLGTVHKYTRIHNLENNYL